MDKEFQIVYRDEPEWDTIGGSLNQYNNQQGGESHGKNLCFVLLTPEQEIVGGVIGETHWDWLYISLMWVKAELRGQGYGHRLLTLAEEEGRQRGAKNVYLDTFSFQAPDFYEKHGYKVFGQLDNFPVGHTRYYLTKELQDR
jgi:ribosomal protein S18 acetylase RimI-like enzyme